LTLQLKAALKFSEIGRAFSKLAELFWCTGRKNNFGTGNTGGMTPEPRLRGKRERWTICGK
jgi:hypothetical protein